MKRLGISIYPEYSSLDSIKRYIKKTSDCGFTRIFTCLISAEQENLDVFKEFIDYANTCGMHVIADVDPNVMETLKLKYTDIGFFKDLGLYGIRLDLGFSGLEESIMTYNDYGLKIEINMSNGTKYLDNILSHEANKNNLLGCHNFYPHVFTGLSYEHFKKCSIDFKNKNIRTAAFVNSSVGKFGPWQVTEGLCTLEDHRDMNIVTQAKDLFYSDLIDDVIIGSMFASDDELEALSRINREKITFQIETIEDLSVIEKKIIFDEFHFCRGDLSEHLIRSTQSRVKYKDQAFTLKNPIHIKRGDIIIESDLYTRYAGELQIALKDMKNTGKSSVVGHICERELHLLDYIKPWSKFAFVKV